METKPSPNPFPKASLLVWTCAAVFVALASANALLFFRVSSLDAQITQLASENRNQLETIRQQSLVLNSQLRSTVKDLDSQLTDTRSKAASDADRARINAQRHAEKLMQSLADDQRLQQQALAEQIGAVRQDSQAGIANTTELTGQIRSVREDLAQTRSTLQSALSDLHSVRGDLGIQSGLIATNAQQLAALKQLGERNYFEFDIRKSQRTVKVGGVVLELKKTDARRNKFNLELIADDKRIEKKDKTLNEPVQFYLSGSRQPAEIVVNQVAKDRIVGYLSTPKLIQARR
ncbi:MAG: hypothetical protein FJW20_21790 [Acidimicrobiia bacterium]|nr:hypothetical protein [Acidimicrobiia bacterium]